MLLLTLEIENFKRNSRLLLKKQKTVVAALGKSYKISYLFCNKQTNNNINSNNMRKHFNIIMKQK